MVDKYGIDHSYIIFEITESASVDAPHVLTSIIESFHSNNFKIWMDDFGSGYSSLSALAAYNFDLIKLDMRFMSDFSKVGKSSIVLKHIFEMADELGMLTLVEGVESLK